MGRNLRRVLLVGLAAATLPLAGPAPLRAQLSPNCRLNNRPAACALTPGETGAERTVVTVVFADNSAWRLEKDERGCIHRHPESICPAVITDSNGYGTPRRGEYRGTWYEGGYRNAWSAPGIRIEYFFMD